MENLVPLGTGNSRFMKSNIQASTTLAQLIQMLNNGTFPYDIGPLNPAGISQQGTPLNKATLLKDATAALFGFGVDALPDDMFNALAHTGDLHVWKRTQNGEVDYPVSPNPDAYQDGTSGNTTIEYLGQLGKKVQLATGSYVGTGTYGANNPNTLTFASAPKIWSIYAYDHNAGTGLWNTFTLSMIIPAGITSFTLPYQGSNATELTLSYNGNAVSWYTETGNSAAMQFNTSGDIYYYWALI